jgi:hypothetical protein
MALKYFMAGQTTRAERAFFDSLVNLAEKEGD